jgi:7-cyano-7-deazaguanine tRNA-ribosyltransferase
LSLQIVAGLSLKSLGPQVWDPTSHYYLPDLKAVMVSYADFHQWPAQRRRSMEQGIHASLGIPKRLKIYLDNGAFYFSARDEQVPIKDYEEFVEEARPDWRPVPRDFIPAPNMTIDEQRRCLNRTMRINRNYQHNGYVPVAHISRVLPDYITRIKGHEQLSAKKAIALGGIVPNLLRAPQALSYKEILDGLEQFRRDFAGKKIHVFGIGGTATIHIARLLRMDSVDSSGWRNRAARGIIQLPGSGERTLIELGSWRGRGLSQTEMEILRLCLCPICQSEGIRGLEATGVCGFRNRATHNLWTLLEELKWVERHLAAGTYREAYKDHLDNTIYRPLIDYLITPAREQR